MKQDLIDAIVAPMERCEFERRDLIVKRFREMLETLDVAVLEELVTNGEKFIADHYKDGSLEKPKCDFDCAFPATDDGCKACPKGGAN